MNGSCLVLESCRVGKEQTKTQGQVAENPANSCRQFVRILECVARDSLTVRKRCRRRGLVLRMIESEVSDMTIVTGNLSMDHSHGENIAHNFDSKNTKAKFDRRSVSP